MKEQGELLVEQAVRLQELETCKFDGVLLWKVQLQDQQGRRIANKFHSPAIYTGRPGYKLSCTLQLDEPDPGSTCLSVELLTGTYDDQLTFPFNGTCKVTIDDHVNTESKRKFEIPCVRLLPRPVNSNVQEQPFNAKVDFIPVNELFGDVYLKDRSLCINLAVCANTDLVDNFSDTLQIS